MTKFKNTLLTSEKSAKHKKDSLDNSMKSLYNAYMKPI